jgi:hypothetical protein
MPLTQYSTVLRACWARRREQWYTPDALKRTRAIRPRDLAEAACRTPYHHSMFTAARIDLQQLPIQEKDVIRSIEPGELLTEGPDALYSVFASGSTGQSLWVMRSARDQSRVSAVWNLVHNESRPERAPDDDAGHRARGASPRLWGLRLAGLLTAGPILAALAGVISSVTWAQWGPRRDEGLR